MWIDTPQERAADTQNLIANGLPGTTYLAEVVDELPAVQGERYRVRCHYWHDDGRVAEHRTRDVYKDTSRIRCEGVLAWLLRRCRHAMYSNANRYPLDKGANHG